LPPWELFAPFVLVVLHLIYREAIADLPGWDERDEPAYRPYLAEKSAERCKFLQLVKYQ